MKILISNRVVTNSHCSRPISAIALLSIIAVSRAAAGAGAVFENAWVPPPPLVRAVVAAPAAPAPAIAARAAIPTKDEQARVRLLLKEVFAKELADKTIPGRRVLAQTFLAQVQKPGSGPAERFVMLVGAIEAAGASANLRAGFEAAELMARDFVVDELAVKLDMAAKTSLRGDSPETLAENVRAALELVDALASAEDFGDAIRLVGVIRPLSIADPEMKATVQKRAATLETLRAAHDRVLAQARILVNSPNDSAANLEVGTFYCFQLGRWEQGLPFLARTADVRLKSAAELELTHPEKPEDIGRLGDGWFDIAVTKTEVTRGRLLQHAISQYRRAVQNTSGLRHTLMEKRIADGEKELEHLLPKSEPVAAAKPALAPNVAAAVNKAVAYILSKQKPDGSWETSPPPVKGDTQQARVHYGGETALAVYALLAAGLDPGSNAPVKAGVDALTKMDVTGVYVLSLRLQALNRLPHPGLYQAQINRDFERLASGMTQDHGLFGYLVPSAGLKAWWDLSNTQYGWIGLASNKSKAKIMPWSVICEFLIIHQQADGSWTYNGTGAGTGTASMTAAGTTLLLLGKDRLPKGRGKERLEASLAGGLKWLDAHHDAKINGFSSYYLLEIQRVGQLTGRKTFNNIDWYAAGCDTLIKRNNRLVH